MKNAFPAVCMLAFLMSIGGFHTARAQTTDAPVQVSVLPIAGDDLSTGLLTILADDFRSALEATGRFSVMTRELMQEIMTEQAFQLTGACDEATCLVEAGRVIGVKQIVAVSITVLPKKKYAVSAKLVDVETGKILKTVSERREGDSYETNKRILTNLASVLAGTPSQDHLDYLRTEQSRLKETKTVEQLMRNKWRLSLSGLGNYPFKILEPDADAIIRSYYETHPDVKSWNMPVRRFEQGFDARFMYHAAKRVWFGVSLGYANKGGTEKYAFEWEQPQDSTYDNGVDPTMYYVGLYTGQHRYSDREQLFSLGAGLLLNMYQSARVTIGLLLMPRIGYAVLTGRTFRNETYDYDWFNNDSSFHSRQITYIDKEETFHSAGLTIGAESGLNAEYFFSPRMSITTHFSCSYQISPYMSGESNRRTVTITRNSVNTDPVVVDSTETVPIGSLLGDWLQKGAFVNHHSDEKEHNDDGELVVTKKHFVEHADLRAGLGIAFYF